MKILLNKFFEFINHKEVKNQVVEKIEPGETELDYIDLNTIKSNKKTPKMSIKKDKKTIKK